MAATTTTIRVPIETYTRLQGLAESEQETIGAVVQRAVEQYDEQRFWARYQQQLIEARADPVGWAKWQEEVAVFDGAMLDGLDEEP